MILHIDLKQIIHALSDALDLVGIDEVQHGKRVAFMAAECGRAMGLDKDQLTTIHNASLLHDCGVSSTQVHKKLVNEFDWADSQDHCIRGAGLLEKCSLFEDLSPIVLYHHTHWQDMPGDLNPDQALISNLIYLTDRVDALIFQYPEHDILLIAHDIILKIKKYTPTFFKPKLVDIFLEVAAKEAFWLTLDTRHLFYYLMDLEKETKEQNINQDTLLEVAKLFAEIVDAKSNYTAQHSSGVASLARFLGKVAGCSNDKLYMLEVAGLLHDLGKLNVPDEILDKPGPLDEHEKAIMMRHSFESYQILRRLNGFEKIAHWAAFHHERLSGIGYPFHKKPDELSKEARIIAVADVFQALAQNRPYRDSLPMEKIMDKMKVMAEKGRLDPQLVDMVRDNLEQCRHFAVSPLN